MRLPWDRSKPPQLDLLALGEPAPMPERPVRALIGEAVVPSSEVPTMTIVEPAPALVGEALLVPLSALYEDPNNPRTEFPEPELQELADDIRQHGILQPIVVQPADAEEEDRNRPDAPHYTRN